MLSIYVDQRKRRWRGEVLKFIDPGRVGHLRIGIRATAATVDIDKLPVDLQLSWTVVGGVEVHLGRDLEQSKVVLASGEKADHLLALVDADVDQLIAAFNDALLCADSAIIGLASLLPRYHMPASP